MINSENVISKCKHDLDLDVCIVFHRFPHPVTFAAMLEMGQAYLPVNHNWDRYINEAEDTYNNLRREMKLYLMRIAKNACSYIENER